MGLDEGLKSAREYPLWDAIFGRRSRRVAAGASFRSGTFSFQSKLAPQPLSKLEEAMLIAATGITGLAFADNPYETTGGKPLLGTPLIEARGRAAGSPDNAQSTHFFMWNDEGTYLLKAPPARSGHPDVRTMSADELIAHAETCKVKVKDGRVDFPRTFPTYASGNRYVSNVPGSTMFVPVTEVTRQYINGLFYVLAQEPGQRPMFVDDFNLFVPCGCERWVKSKFLNRRIPIPLSLYAKGRTEYESLLLLQNLALVSQGMGLGGWIHAAFASTILLGGYPDIGPGLGFRFEKPKGLPLPRPYPASVDNPVGLDGLLQSYAPPYFRDTDAAIDAILAEKYGPDGLYHDGATANPGMKADSAAAFAREASHVEPEVVEVVRAICRYIWRTYGRFPAHCHAIDSSGVWMQCHHIDPEFYEQHFTEAFSSTQAAHARAWHDGSPAIVGARPRPGFEMIDWTDARLDDMFLRSEARPLDGFLNAGSHRVELASHEIYNDQRWKGFMPRGLPASEATARLSLGFAKKLWKAGTGFGGETQYFGGTITTEHSIQEITLDRQTHDLPPGRYVLLGYTDPVFENLFYDLLKPISDNVMLFRGYTGRFPDGKRGWTALLLRRYPFAQMGIDDNDLLFAGRPSPTEEDLLGTWHLDALYYSNQPVHIAHLRFDRSKNGQLHIDCDTSRSGRGLLLPQFVSDHFQTERIPTLQGELRTVDRHYMVGKWTTDIGGAYAKFLLAGSPGLFHPDEGTGHARRFTLYYLLTRMPSK